MPGMADALRIHYGRYESDPSVKKTSVTTTPAKLVDDVTNGKNVNTRRVLLVNTDNADALGYWLQPVGEAADARTVDNSIPLLAGQERVLTFPQNFTLWGVSAGTTTVIATVDEH